MKNNGPIILATKPPTAMWTVASMEKRHAMPQQMLPLLRVANTNPQEFVDQLVVIKNKHARAGASMLTEIKWMTKIIVVLLE